MSSPNIVARLCDLVMLIRKQPRTVRDICEIQGLDPKDQAATVRKWLAEMHEAGLVYICEYRPSERAAWPAVYAWQPEPFEKADAQREAVEA